MNDDRFFDHAYVISTSEETLEHYARFADVYDAEVTEQGYAQPRRVVEMVERFGLASDTRVLDVGCGTGLSGIALRSAGFSQIDGCDYSREMLDGAERLGVYDRLFWADLNDPPIDAVSGEYGLATAVGIFAAGHLEIDAMDEILRAVEPGGVFVAGMNEYYFTDADVSGKLASLEAAGAVSDVVAERGEHMPGLSIEGWVVAMRVTGTTTTDGETQR